MNEIKELWKPAKRKGATRMIISGFKRNMYFIDLIDFSSKQHKWVNKLTNKQFIDLQEILSGPLTACYVRTFRPWTSSQ